MKSMVSRNPTRKDADAKAAMVELYPYQREAAVDESRFCLDVWARQTGKDFAKSLKHTRRRMRLGGDSYCICPSERQSMQAVEKVKLHAAVLEAAFDYDELDWPGVDGLVKQVIFKDNRARFLAFPGNPETVRGFSGDTWLNEFAFFKNSIQMWRAAVAIVSRGYVLDVTSTPNGQQGKFCDLSKLVGIPMEGGRIARTRWVEKGWSVSRITIYDAVEQGCPINIPELRQAIDDEDTWLQEEELHFLADAENYIPMELVIACESEAATLELPANFVAQGELYLGGDIGRRKDRTVFWLKEKIGDVKWTRAVLTLQRTPFEAQWSILDQLLAMCRRACLDASGLGMHLAERAVTKYGEGRVEAVNFNLENKERMATLQKKEMEERRERIPASAQIRRAFNAVKRYSSPTGHFRFDAQRTDAGHADEFWASALATAAAEGAPAAAIAAADSEPDWYRAARRSLIGGQQEENPEFAPLMEREERRLMGVR